MKCSRCTATARPGQKLCHECHAADMRVRRAESRDRLVRIESKLERLEVLEAFVAEYITAGRKAPHPVTPQQIEARRRA